MFSRIALVTVLIVGACLGQSAAQEPETKAKVVSPAEMRELMGPGPEHEPLARCSGSWTLSIKSGPRGGATECFAENRMIVGGRFLQIQYASADKTAEGEFTIGFDRRHKHYTLTALDTFGTYAVHSQGKREGDAGKIKMYGKDDDPMMKSLGFTKEFVHVVDLRGPDEFAIEVWFVDTRTAERKEIKSMEYVFKRKK